MKQLACFIVETRNVPNLVKIINGYLKYLPSDMELFIYHGEETAYLKSFYPKATLIPLPEAHIDIPFYNALLTSSKFWTTFLDFRRVLCIQADGGALRWGIEEFVDMPYGFYGASHWFNLVCSSNGGVSLRDPKLMYEICSKYPWNGYSNEDMHFSKIICKDYPDRMAPREIRDQFSVESVFATGSMFYHSPEKYLTPEQCEEIMNQIKITMS